MFTINTTNKQILIILLIRSIEGRMCGGQVHVRK